MNAWSSASRTDGSAAQPGPASAAQPGAASAAQPGPAVQNFQSLQVLRSKQSTNISTFKVVVCAPWKDTYEYQWEGKPRETTAWRCTLVRADDRTEYCNGEYKLTNKNKPSFEKHVKKTISTVAL